MAATLETHSDALLESDAELRTLIGAILNGGDKDDIYLNDVSSICHRKPQSADALRELIDRYHRLGRVPLVQRQRIQAKIDQAEAARECAAARGGDADARAEELTREVPDDLTCDLSSESINASAARPFPRHSDIRVEGLTDLTPTVESPPPSRRGPVPIAWEKLTANRLAATSPRAKAPTNGSAPRPAAARHTAPNRIPLAKPPALLAAPALPRLASRSTPPEPVPLAAPSAPNPLGPGSVLKNRYELQQLMGRGGMALVYKAIDRDRVRLGLADCYVAVKIVPINTARPATHTALIQEFQSAQRLSHPNIINVFDIDQDQDSTFYSMELLSGVRLSQLLRRVDGTVLQRHHSLAIIREIGAAVAHAHARGVVHADLKPSNVMVTLDGEVRVLDFGGPSMPPREPWVSEGDDEEGYHQATPAYASCEQLERRRADPRDDIYALACIAYLLLSGRHPFDYLPSIEARARNMQARRPAGMPFAQWRVLRRGLAWNREQRSLSIDDWLRQFGLRNAAQTLPPLADLTAAVSAPRHAWRGPMGVAAVVLASGAALIWLNSTERIDWSAARAQLLGTWQSVQSLGNVEPERPPAATHSAPAAAAPSTHTPTSPAAVVARANVTHAAAARAAVTAPTPTIVARAAAPAPAVIVPAPVAKAPAAAAAPSTHTASVTFATPNYAVAAGDPAARIVIQRQNGVQGELNFIWWTEEGSAEPEVDYASLGARTEHMASGQDKLTVYVPIISSPLRRRSSQFSVALVDAASHRGEGSPLPQPARATVTILGGG